MSVRPSRTAGERGDLLAAALPAESPAVPTVGDSTDSPTRVVNDPAAGPIVPVAGSVGALERRVLEAAAEGDLVTFRRLADELDGGLEAAQALVRTRGAVARPGTFAVGSD
jgi:hypothetical protein